MILYGSAWGLVQGDIGVVLVAPYDIVEQGLRRQRKVAVSQAQPGFEGAGMLAVDVGVPVSPAV